MIGNSRIGSMNSSPLGSCEFLEISNQGTYERITAMNSDSLIQRVRALFDFRHTTNEQNKSKVGSNSGNIILAQPSFLHSFRLLYYGVPSKSTNFATCRSRAFLRDVCVCNKSRIVAGGWSGSIVSRVLCAWILPWPSIFQARYCLFEPFLTVEPIASCVGVFAVLRPISV